MQQLPEITIHNVFSRHHRHLAHLEDSRKWKWFISSIPFVNDKLDKALHNQSEICLDWTECELNHKYTYHRKWESCETYKEIDRVVVVFKVFLIYSEFSFPGTISLQEWNKFGESAIDYCLFSSQPSWHVWAWHRISAFKALRTAELCIQ